MVYFCSHLRVKIKYLLFSFLMKKIRAFIDLGTNTFHLLIAAIGDGHYDVLFRTKLIVGLGAGGINDNIITDEARHRGLQCLIDFAGICQEYKVDMINAYGTSALRNATNSEEFRAEVLRVAEIKIDIIDGETEAELIQMGISANLPVMKEPYLIMDIGGGSTEFILVEQDEIRWKQSFEVGVQRLLSAYFSTDPIPPGELHALNNYLGKFLNDLESLKSYNPKNLVGASGTYTTLASMYSEESGVNESANLFVPAPFFDSVFDKITTLPRHERQKLAGMSAPRVDLIVVGSCLVAHVMKFFGFKGFYVSGNGLKEGAMLLASKGKI